MHKKKLLQLTYRSEVTTSPSILSIEVSESQSRNQKRNIPPRLAIAILRAGLLKPIVL